MNKLLIGFTAGLVFGILYAPAKGKDTRNKLRCMGTGLRDGWNDVSEIVVDKIESLREDMDDIADQAIVTIEDARFEKGKEF